MNDEKELAGSTDEQPVSVIESARNGSLWSRSPVRLKSPLAGVVARPPTEEEVAELRVAADKTYEESIFGGKPSSVTEAGVGTDPTQEAVIREALESLITAIKQAGKEMSALRAERDLARAERDTALSLDGLPLGEWPADARDARHQLERAEWAERAEKAESERDTALTALHGLREAVAEVLDPDLSGDTPEAVERLVSLRPRARAALAATPADLAARALAKARASALREAADAIDWKDSPGEHTNVWMEGRMQQAAANAAHLRALADEAERPVATVETKP